MPPNIYSPADLSLVPLEERTTKPGDKGNDGKKKKRLFAASDIPQGGLQVSQTELHTLKELIYAQSACHKCPGHRSLLSCLSTLSLCRDRISAPRRPFPYS